jgi:hypothetical protein
VSGPGYWCAACGNTGSADLFRLWALRALALTVAPILEACIRDNVTGLHVVVWWNQLGQPQRHIDEKSTDWLCPSNSEPFKENSNCVHLMH